MRDRRPEAQPVRLRDREPSPALESPESARSRPGPRAWRAAARTVLCCAGVHVLILFVSALRHGDASVFNVLTMIEAQRLWPALAQSPAAPWWSLAALLALYGAAYGTLARDDHARRAAPRPHQGGAVSWLGRAAARLSAPAGIVAPGFAPVGRPALALAPGTATLATGMLRFQPSLRDGLLTLLMGLALHMTSLAAIERFVSVFPAVPDVLHANLPYVDFGPPGELVYAAFLVALVTVLLRRQPHTVPAILFLLGVFYGLRGVFLFLLPIGIPPTAPPLEARFVLWPFAGHAYFPGGHTGIMTVLSLSVLSRGWRRAFLVTTFAFAVGTLLSRTHYTADALGGWCIGYFIVLWGRGHVVPRPASFSVKRDTAWSPATRREQEV